MTQSDFFRTKTALNSLYIRLFFVAFIGGFEVHFLWGGGVQEMRLIRFIQLFLFYKTFSFIFRWRDLLLNISHVSIDPVGIVRTNITDYT